MTPSFWDLLLRSNQELEAMGVATSEATPLRQSFTGHTRRLHVTWAGTIGMWGRIRGIEAIAGAVRRDARDVRNHASTAGLKYATRSETRTQPELAVRLYCDRGRDPRESARAFGVMPCERVLYLAGVQLVLDEHALTIEELLEWPLHALEETWRDLGAEVRPRGDAARPTMLPWHDGEAVEAAVRHVIGGEA